MLFDVSMDVHHSVFSVFTLSSVYVNVHVAVLVGAIRLCVCGCFFFSDDWACEVQSVM